MHNFVNLFTSFNNLVILKISYRALYKMLKINFDHITFGTR